MLQDTIATVNAGQSEISAEEVIISCNNVDFAYGSKQALFDVSMEIPRKKVTAFIGPSGCGKSTLLRCFNRINDRIDGASITKGGIWVKGKNINDKDVDVTALRRQVGMVFQKSNPFPMTIYDNITYGLRIQGISSRAILDEAVERSLRSAVLWDELKDRLKEYGTALSGGQQQRLCIARAIAVKPEIILMDEPCSALDPIATLKIEDLMESLKKDFTVVIVTHNMQQAMRIADRTAFLYMGKLIEYAPTLDIFHKPKCKETEDYVSGRFG